MIEYFKNINTILGKSPNDNVVNKLVQRGINPLGSQLCDCYPYIYVKEQKLSYTVEIFDKNKDIADLTISKKHEDFYSVEAYFNFLDVVIDIEAGADSKKISDDIVKKFIEQIKFERTNQKIIVKNNRGFTVYDYESLKEGK